MFKKLLHKITNRHYHFKVLVTYTPDSANAGMNITALRTVWFADRSLITKEREIKKSIGPKFIIRIPKKYLRNGQLELSAFYYLGWFKPANKK